MRFLRLFGYATILAAACTPSSHGTTVDRKQDGDSYSIVNPDGTYDLYLGPGVAALVQAGPSADGLKSHPYFKLGRVPARLVELARKRTNKIVSFSLEDKTLAPLTIVVNYLVQREPINITAVAGDPALSGTGQVRIDDDTNSPMGLFEARVMRPGKFSGQPSPSIYSTGLMLDPDPPPPRM
jgi:hypothetical protein